jgi:NAD(P)-dependent dehydrogenase (short-subunit alcohol dehydrogenase family)
VSAKLDGRVVLVTGAESGIGKSIALCCAAEGACVAIIGLNTALAEQAAGEVERAGGTAIALRGDVREQAEVEGALAATVSAFGRLDAVVANAGIAQRPAAFVDLSLEEWSSIVATNLTGTFLTLQAGARRLVEQGDGGSLLAIGSSSVFRPRGGAAIGYVAAKGGVHAMIRALTMELAPHRIRVNAIAPGMTDTPLQQSMPAHTEEGLRIVPLGELIPPDEIGALAAYMLSGDARNMTGSIVRLDAGRTAD